jgi:hypothetical protein
VAEWRCLVSSVFFLQRFSAYDKKDGGQTENLPGARNQKNENENENENFTVQ